MLYPPQQEMTFISYRGVPQLSWFIAALKKPTITPQLKLTDSVSDPVKSSFLSARLPIWPYNAYDLFRTPTLSYIRDHQCRRIKIKLSGVGLELLSY